MEQFCYLELIKNVNLHRKICVNLHKKKYVNLVCKKCQFCIPKKFLIFA